MFILKKNLASLLFRLYGNKIAEVGDTFIRLFDGGHQSVTTKSRLNAILAEHGDDGDCVFQKNFDWFVNINTVQGITTVPFLLINAPGLITFKGERIFSLLFLTFKNPTGGSTPDPARLGHLLKLNNPEIIIGRQGRFRPLSSSVLPRTSFDFEPILHPDPYRLPTPSGQFATGTRWRHHDHKCPIVPLVETPPMDFHNTSLD